MPSLNTSDDEYLAVLDALALSAEPVFAVNDRHRIVFWNKAMRHLLGFEYEDVAGKPCGGTLSGRDTFGNRYCGETCAVFSIMRRGESIRPFRMTVTTKTGEAMIIDLVALKFEMRTNHRPLLAYVVHQAGNEIGAAPPRELSAQPTASTVASDPRVDELTRREIEVLRMVAEGQNAGGIARILGISPLTARNHIQKVFAKIEVHSKAEAVAFAYRTHLV
jgi:DNA-binding CsgD family transcriptional regulator